MDRYPISGSIKFSCEKQVPELSLPTDERCIILHSFFWTLLAQRPKNCSVHTFNARSRYDISKLMHGMYIPEFYKPRVNLFMGLSSFSFTQWAPNKWCRVSALRSFKIIESGTNWKPVRDFLLVVNRNLRRISHHFQDTAMKTAGNPDFFEYQFYPLLARVFASDLPDEIWFWKNRVPGLPNGENGIILLSSILTL